ICAGRFRAARPSGARPPQLAGRTAAGSEGVLRARMRLYRSTPERGLDVPRAGLRLKESRWQNRRRAAHPATAAESQWKAWEASLREVRKPSRFSLGSPLKNIIKVRT